MSSAPITLTVRAIYDPSLSAMDLFRRLPSPWPEWQTSKWLHDDFCCEDGCPETTPRDEALAEWRQRTREVPFYQIRRHEVVDGKATLSDGRVVNSTAAYVDEAVLKNSEALAAYPTRDWLVERGYLLPEGVAGVATPDELKTGIPVGWRHHVPSQEGSFA